VELTLPQLEYFIKDLSGREECGVIADYDLLNFTKKLSIYYEHPEDLKFHDGLIRALARFGWEFIEKRLDLSPKRIYLNFKQDEGIDPDVQAERLVKLLEEQDAKQAGKREINF